MEHKNEKGEEPESQSQPSKPSNAQRFLQISGREGRNSTPESLICAKLWRAGSSDKLTRVLCIVECAWNALTLWPDKFKPDPKLIESLYNVTSALSAAKPSKNTLDGYHIFNYQPIPWSFNKSNENFDKFINPWLSSIPNYYSGLVSDIEPYREYYTRFLCPYCKTELGHFQHGKGNMTVASFLEKYEKKKLIKEKKHALCDIEKHKQDMRKLLRFDLYSMPR